MERIPAGNVVFLVETREAGGDGGPSIQVRASLEGRDVQLLRFDCFRQQPHYHYEPDGADVQYELDPTVIEDSLSWVLIQLESKLGQMLVRAGYEPLAQGLDPSAVKAGLQQVEAHFRASAPSAS